MKTTIKAVLIDPNEEQRRIIDNMMIIFCTAIRYSFKRLIEGAAIRELEKDASRKYGLNIRQAKDAVENARQTIVSQRELIELNYKNYSKKVNAIEKLLKDSNTDLSKKKEKALLSKLDKRKRRQSYYKKLIENKSIPPVIFGTKEMFIKRCKGLISREEWNSCRNNRIYSRGDKTKKGNPNLRVIIIQGMSFLEISTLDRVGKNRAVKVRVPIYLPQKYSRKTGKINGRNYRQLFLDYLETGEAYQVEIIKRRNMYYAHITFVEQEIKKAQNNSNKIGIDTNPDGFALTCIDNIGNYKWSRYLKQHELLYSRGNRRINLCGELAKKAVTIAKENNCQIALEDLEFKDDVDTLSKFSRVKHQFIYRTLLQMLERACKREGIGFTKVRPQFTSKIGLYKYCHQYRISIHNGAAMVIARRGYRFKEKIPNILTDKLIKNTNEFNKQNEWKKWVIINKVIEEKGGKTPGLWMKNRKTILGMDKVS